jgi:hypothetical protein
MSDTDQEEVTRRTDTVKLKNVSKVPNPDAFCRINFLVRYHAEVLLANNKLAPKIFTTDVCSILQLSGKSKVKQELCIRYLNMITRQRPDWNYLKRELEKDVQEPPKDTRLDFLPIPRVAIDVNGDIQMFPVRMDDSNRVLRHFAEFSDHFLRVEFKAASTRIKEDRVPKLEKNKRRALTHGLTIAGRHYEFLMV